LTRRLRPRGRRPDVWTELGGVAIDGILSHGFLRRYAWTLDFEAMTMTFSTPDA
jgi:hypothetical protein